MKVTYDGVEQYCPGWKMLCDIILSLTILRGVLLANDKLVNHACRWLPDNMRKSKYFCAPGFAENNRLVVKLGSPDVSVSVTKTPDRNFQFAGGKSVNVARISIVIKANTDDKDPVILKINPQTEQFA